MTDQSLKANRLEIARELLETEIENLHPEERQAIEQFVNRGRVARNVLREFDERLTFGQRVADQVAKFGGSWTFIFIFLGTLIVWMLFNTFVLARQAFDPFPYILLNLLLSCLAALQAPVIMMSQNRMAEKDRIQAKHDYEVNIKAELEILQIQEKINELRERDWIALIEMQQKQIELLERLLAEADARTRQTLKG
ncbi:MAG TPA: DUF1003 domain-containing protein [Blastocatellia bacterium]|jgi:uncharacterized membrane protein